MLKKKSFSICWKILRVQVFVNDVLLTWGKEHCPKT